ncbi:MAG: tetratricopeptide repeat protein [Pirellulales bacterium]
MSREVMDDQKQQQADKHPPLQKRRGPRPGRLSAQPLLADDHPADHPGVRRLYTAALMAAVLDVPPAAVRHWIRGGLLQVAESAGSVEWFDFEQLVVGRHLARLLSRGLSLREIDAKLTDLVPGGVRAAADAAGRILIDGRRLSIDDGGRLLSAGGQLQFGFYTSPLAATHDCDRESVVGMPAIGPGHAAASDPAGLSISLEDVGGLPPLAADMAEILDLADDLEAAGEFVEAAEALRAVLQAQGPTPRVMFMLAELLYRAGDLTAARERYYAVIELDPDHLQARSSLGCVLAELGEHDLALAALEGVLRQAPAYADAHWHIAGVLRETGLATEAAHHLRRFLALAPESPWATLARDRLDQIPASPTARGDG